MKDLTSAELEFCFYKQGQSGSFSTNLFKAILSADFGNQYKLSFGFPDEVEVVKRYQNEGGYWEQLQSKFNNNENKEA
jgi:hypothetical protein